MRRLVLVLPILAIGAAAHAAPPSAVSVSLPKVRHPGLPAVGHAARVAPKAVADLQAERRVLQLRLSRRTSGDRLFNTRRYEEALHVYDTLLSEDDRDVTVLERAAVARTRLGDFGGAAAAWGRILDLLGPRPTRGVRRVDIFSGKQIDSDEYYHRILGRASHGWSLEGDHARALDAAEVVAARLDDPSSGSLLLADAYMHAGLADEAEALFLDVLAREPDNGAALNNLSTIRYLQRDLDGTMELLEAVLERNREPRLEAIAISNVAEVLMLRGDYANAEAHYRSALDVYADGAFAHLGLAALLNVTGRHEAALDAAMTGWDLDRGGLDREHEYFLDEEWRWQRDAFTAEAEGRFEDAVDAWDSVREGQVKPLVMPARGHARRLRALLAE